MLHGAVNGYVCGLRSMDTVAVPMNPALPDLRFRFLEPSDIEQVMALSRECFPINYPDSWFVEITSSPKLCSLAAIHAGRIIGMIVVEVKPLSACNQEACVVKDSDLLSYATGRDAQVAYILSLGIFKEHRRSGIGSVLLQQVLDHLQKTGKLKSDCKAIYLHCMTSNVSALKFYKKWRFMEHSYLPNYYGSSAQPADAYCYVKYINGGEPPWSLRDVTVTTTRILCTLLRRCLCSLPYRSSQLVQYLTRRVWSSPHSSETRKL